MTSEYLAGRKPSRGWVRLPNGSSLYYQSRAELIIASVLSGEGHDVSRGGNLTYINPQGRRCRWLVDLAVRFRGSSDVTLIEIKPRATLAETVAVENSIYRNAGDRTRAKFVQHPQVRLYALDDGQQWEMRYEALLGDGIFDDTGHPAPTRGEIHAAQRKRLRDRDRKRYASDPEYRDSHRERKRRAYHEQCTNPETHELLKAQSRERARRIYADPARRSAILARRRSRRSARRDNDAAVNPGTDVVTSPAPGTATIS